jgi:mono/diheme cytochrome c family protein
VIRLAKDGSVQSQSAGIPAAGLGVARVAWRMIASPSEATTAEDPGESVLIAAQRTPDELAVPPETPPAYYESESGCMALGPLTLVSERRVPLIVPNVVLPIDIATNGHLMVLVSAGNSHMPGRSQLVWLDRRDFMSACGAAGEITLNDQVEITSIVHEPVTDHFFALSREPALLIEFDARINQEVSAVALSDVSRRDTGHAIFHASSGRGRTACASCHPEGRDDGHSWRSVILGPRRTPSLIGTVAGTAPYHWNGEASGLDDLMTMTFTQRMRGPELRADQKAAIGSWLGELPGLSRSSSSISFSPSAVRGRAIFESATARCSSCHAGALLTNNATLDVGTGGEMQVPSLLGVVHRAPYLHDGSHPHLRSILRSPHGGATVRADEVDDLASYLESL